jgi:hypothetical protein
LGSAGVAVGGGRSAHRGDLECVKRFTSIEVGGLILAALLFGGGLACVIRPRATVVVHLTNNVLGWLESSVEEVSTTGARFYGILGMLLGTGIAALAIYRAKT